MYIKKRFEDAAAADPDTSDRRSIKRRHLIYYLRVWDTATEQVIGHVVDITTEGLMLISDREISLNQTFDLELRWNGGEQGERTIAFRAQSRWIDNDVNPAFYDIGFKLLEDSKSVLEPIAELIDNYGFND